MAQLTYYDYLGRAMPESRPETGNITGSQIGGETLYAPAGDSSVSGAGGGDLLVGGPGDNRFWITHPDDRISDSGGVDTQIGWLSLKLAPGIENLVVHNDFNYAIGNELDNLIVVDGSQWVDGGPGNDVLVGSSDQRTTFIARAGDGNDVIYNWNNNSQIHFVGHAFRSAAEVRAAMTERGGDVVIQLSPSETLTVRGVPASSFEDRQLLLPLDTAKIGALTFHDEFDALNTFNPNTGTGQWRTDFGGNLKDAWAYTIPANGEQQAYVAPGFYGQGTKDLGVNPFAVKDGVLTISAAPSPDAYASYFRPYTSGMLNTIGGFSQKYGYFEARVDTPDVNGTWGAFWMVPSPYMPNAEADIFESLGVTPHVDYRRAWGGEGEAGTQYDNVYKAEPSGFHTYGMLWTPDTTTFYLDGVAVMTGPTPSTWTQPMALILNLAVGGWGGNPVAADYPADMKVDYVRAYALADGSSQVVVSPYEHPIATLEPDGPSSGETVIQPLFAGAGQPVGAGRIAVGMPSSTPAPHTFVIWEDAGAVFGAVSDGAGLSKATALLAGSVSQFHGDGTWLTTGKVVTGYFAENGTGGTDLWSLVFDPADSSWARQNLGPASAAGKVSFIATEAGGFAVSWHAPDGAVMARGYDEYAYGGDPGWYGPTRALSGDLIGVNGQGQLIASSATGQELYHLHGATKVPPPPVAIQQDAGPAEAAPAPADGADGQAAHNHAVGASPDLGGFDLSGVGLIDNGTAISFDFGAGGGSTSVPPVPVSDIHYADPFPSDDLAGGVSTSAFDPGFPGHGHDGLDAAWAGDPAHPAYLGASATEFVF